METTEWFACLDYGKIDILIPQTTILESNFFEDKIDRDYPGVFSLDEYIKEVLHIYIEENKQTHLIIRGKKPFHLISSAVPVVEQISYREFTLLKEPAGNFLLKQGFIAFRDHNDKFQYVLDTETLYLRWKK